MKKILCLLLTLTLVFSTVSVAFAKPNTQDTKKKEAQKDSGKHHNKMKEKKQEFKMEGGPVIKYGKYKLPIKAVTQGMKAAVTFDKQTAILTVTKGNVVIVINFKEKTSTVNGVLDENSGIFTTSNDKKSKVLIKYIANKLGVRITQEKDKVIVVTPGLDLPKNVTITTTGTNQVANTVNSTTESLVITADITTGQATGGKAWLYIGSKHISTDGHIKANDKKVTFKFDVDDLRDLIKEGGVVSVRLYNANKEYVDSKDGNPILTVDYSTPVTPTPEVPTPTPEAPTPEPSESN